MKLKLKGESEEQWPVSGAPPGMCAPTFFFYLLIFSTKMSF